MNVAIRKLVTPYGQNQYEVIDPMPSLEFAKESIARHLRSIVNDPAVSDVRATDLGLSFVTPLNRVAWSIIPLNGDEMNYRLGDLVYHTPTGWVYSICSVEDGEYLLESVDDAPNVWQWVRASELRLLPTSNRKV